MSIRSTPYPLHNDVKNNTQIKKTHVSHLEYQKKNAKVSATQMNISGSMDSDLMSVNYLDDRKLCSLEPSAFGNISGCSVHHQDIFKNPQPDFVEKISDRSFSSQLFKSHYGTINDEALHIKKNNKNPGRENKQDKPLPGLELKKGLQLNRIDGLPNDLDARDLYESYCHKKYKTNLFKNTN